MPLIAALLAQGCCVLLASHGAQAALLQEAFPQLEMLPLPGYGVQYSRKRVWWAILRQWPKINAAIRAEHRWVQPLVHTRKIDAIISDNRYGLWARGCHNVLLTHQLQPMLPTGWQWLQPLARWLFYRKLRPFQEVWVPDLANAQQSLSGVMGHPPVRPRVPLYYIGWLSRFKAGPAGTGKKYTLLIVLSGPEPQRTLLENLLLQQLATWPQPVLLVRGRPLDTTAIQAPPYVTVVHHLPAAQLQQAMLHSQYLLGRGGYTTLMDAVALGLRCIVVPTPGQTEQEYLAALLAKREMVLHVPQEGFDLATVMERAAQYPFRMPAAPAHTLQAHVAHWCQRM
jgi:hypothetical protein